MGALEGSGLLRVTAPAGLLPKRPAPLRRENHRRSWHLDPKANGDAGTVDVQDRPVRVADGVQVGRQEHDVDRLGLRLANLRRLEASICGERPQVLAERADHPLGKWGAGRLSAE